MTVVSELRLSPRIALHASSHASLCTALCTALVLCVLTAGTLHAQRSGAQRRPAPTSRPVADITDSLPDVSPRAMKLWREAIVVDTHNDMPTKVADERYDADLRNVVGFGQGKGSTDYPRLLQSGLTGVFMSAFVDAPYAIMKPDSSFARAMMLTNQV